MTGTIDESKSIRALSAEALGIIPREKSQSGVSTKSMSKKKAEVSIGYGFSAEELDAEIDIDELTKNDIAVSNKMEQEGLDIFRIEAPKPNTDTAKEKMGEICLTQILFYKGLQEFRHKLSEEFIKSFSPAEQAFLRKMAERLDDYIQVYKEHVDQLLNLLGYSSLELFVDEMLALPKPEIRESSRQVSFTMEEQNHRSDFLSGVGDWLSTISKNLGMAAPAAKPVAVRKDERLAQLVDCARVNRENMALCLAGKFNSPEKMAQFLKIARSTGEKVSYIPQRVAKYGAKYKNLALYYTQSTLPQHAERRTQCIQAGTSIVSPGNGYDLNTYIFNSVLPRIGLLYRELAECIDKEWVDASLGNVSDYVVQLRKEDAKVLRQKNEAERNYVLSPMSLLPDNDPAQAKKGNIYIDENTYHYLVLGADGKPKTGILPREFTKPGENGGGSFTIDLHDFQARLEDEKLVKAVLAFTSMKGHTIDNNIAGIRRPKSVHRLSGIMVRAEGLVTRVKSAIVTQGRFSGEKTDICTEGSYFSYVRRAWEVVQSYQGAKEGDVSTEGWTLKRVRSGGTRTEQKSSKISERFRKGSPAEIYQHDELVCTITPQKVAGGAKNEFNGVGIEVHRHQDKDIALAIRIMAASLVGKKKEICVTVDLDKPGTDELALQYVWGILKQCITPVLCDGIKELSIEETKIKLIELSAAMAAKGNHHYDSLVELYEDRLEKVEIEKEEDEGFLAAFDAFIEAAPKTSMQYPKGMPLNKGAIVSKLALVFKHRNLTTGQFVDKIACYARQIAPHKGALFTPKQFESLKEKLRNYVDYCISNELLDLNSAESEDFKEEHFARQIFNMAFGALEPELDMALYEDYFFSARKLKESPLQVELAKEPSGVSAPQVMVQDSEPKLSEEEKAQKDSREALKLQNDDLSDITVVTENSNVSTKQVAMSVDATDSESEAQDVFGKGSLDEHFIKEFIPDQEQAEIQDVQIRDLQIDTAWIDDELLKMEVQHTQELYSEMDTVLAPEKEVMPEIQTLEVRVSAAPTHEDKMQAPEIIEIKESRLSLAQKEFAQRVTSLYDRRDKIGPDWRFRRALAAYALFLGEIRHENFDLADALVSEISYIIADAEQILEIDKSKYVAVDRQDIKNKYEALLKNISAALRAELQSAKTDDNSLESVAAQMLAQELKERQELKEILAEREETSSENQADEEAVASESHHPINPETRKVSETSGAEELDDLLKVLDDEIASVYSDNTQDSNADKKETSQPVVIQPKCFSIFGPKCHVNTVAVKESAHSSASDKPDSHKDVTQDAKSNNKPFSEQAKWFGMFGPKCPGARNRKSQEAETTVTVSTPAHRGR